LSRERTAGELLGIGDRLPAVIAIVGCGGKTSFIESLARECAGRKVLISPTTKIFLPRMEGTALYVTPEEWAGPASAPGIRFAGVPNPETGKLEALPPETLAGLVPGYDLTLLEADGSKGLPCKGWRDYEPVVPPYCTDTVGIVGFCGLGKRAGPGTVHRPEEFRRLTRIGEGETVTAEALRKMVCAENGMFRRSAGRRSVFVNLWDGESAEEAARDFLEGIARAHPGRFSCLAYGNARENRWKEVPHAA